ncbi:hypothetical protein C2E25_05790 [Geothermobacter hydrogeniphilus]|uniref:OmpA-like domain-containing protein n=1 Tax=Geothermobacter hydrogeniphilus TaxID=1969733 RepID=A0A2K2HBX9_9BACT|nr:hypothetical protein C2E25_05790 [Geothermobacter hydrogeniphilus]
MVEEDSVLSRLLLSLLLVLLVSGCAAPVTSPAVPVADRDGDGVPDSADRCPDSSATVRVGADGCPLDADRDGVFDHLDRCPDTLPGLPVGLDGCPPDGDGDGVPDGTDRCPGTVVDSNVDDRGCPPASETAVSARKELPQLELQVLFRTGESVLQEGSEREFERGVAFIRHHPHRRVIIEGHTDSVGPAAYNRRLSQRRAEVVRQALVDRLGASAPPMEVVGVGEDHPPAANSTQQGRARNRRVVIRIAEYLNP